MAHGLSTSVYADDDTQIYVATASENCSGIESCISEVKKWTNQNKLVFNDSESEILHITSIYRSTTTLPGLNIGNSFVTSSSCVRDLGIILKNHLSMKNHVNNIVKCAFF